MDENQKPQETISQQPTNEAVNPVIVSQPMSQSQLEQLSKSEKPKLIKSLLALLVITFWLGLSFLGLVLGDVEAGILRGEPETGWGILFALFFVGPPLLIVGLITLIRVIRLRKDGHKIGRTVKMAGIVTAILLLISVTYSFGMSKYEDYASRDRKAQSQRQAELNKPEAITISYATELLNTCKVKAFYYGDIVKSEEIKAEFNKSNDGVVLVKLAGPYNIQIADRAKAELLPVAENAKKNCEKFTINGN